jgi:hypothetical protein
MTDVCTDKAVRRTPLRLVIDGHTTSPPKPASVVSPERKEFETVSSAEAKPPASLLDQEPCAAPEQPRSRVPRKWVRAPWLLLLALLLIAGACWYVTGIQVTFTDDPYVDVGEVGISTDVCRIVKDIYAAKNQHATVEQILYRLGPHRFEIAFESAKTNLARIARRGERTHA